MKIAANAGLKSLVLDIEEGNVPRYVWRSAWAQDGEPEPEYTLTASVTTGTMVVYVLRVQEFGAQ